MFLFFPENKQKHRHLRHQLPNSTVTQWLRRWRWGWRSGDEGDDVRMRRSRVRWRSSDRGDDGGDG